MGSVRNVECFHTPVRTAGSASSSMTAAMPPTSRAMGFLKIRHDVESGGTSAASPRGRLKSILRPFGGCRRAWAVDSRLSCMLRGSRMIGIMLEVYAPMARVERAVVERL